MALRDTVVQPGFVNGAAVQYFAADRFPRMSPIHWLNTHFAVGGWSPLQRLSGMLTAHMSQIAPRSGFPWHPHRGLEIYTWVLEGELYHEDTTGGRGVIRAGELQRMFAGEYIEHQELNQGDVPARVIQIWYIADIRYRGLPSHYQQVSRAEMPERMVDGASVYDLIGGSSPMEHHMHGRLTASVLPAGAQTRVEPPRDGESLFLYVTDGDGKIDTTGFNHSLAQYDVVLARPDADAVTIQGGEQPLHYLSFYLPAFY